jgi:hypothetical protein
MNGRAGPIGNEFIKTFDYDDEEDLVDEKD